MNDMVLFERFQRRFGSTVPAEDKEFVLQALEDAANAVCDLTGRDIVPERLTDVQVELAIIAYNRRGTEGESSRSEGGISQSFESLSPLMLARLKNYPRKVGVVYAVSKAKPDGDNTAPLEENG